MSAAKDEFEETLGRIDRCIRKFSDPMTPAEEVPTLLLCADLARELARAADRYSVALRSDVLP